MAPKDESVVSSSVNTSTTSSDNKDDEEDPIDVFCQILQSPTPFQDDKEESACRQVLNDLTEEEQEETAAASYAYWYLTTQYNNDESNDNNDDDGHARRRRDHMALKEIRRHYIGEGKHHDKTLTAIREALAYRKEYQVNDLRKCFRKTTTTTTKDNSNDDNTNDKNDNNNNNNDNNNDLESLVLQDLKHQLLVTRGYSKTGCGVAYKFGRKALTAETNEHAFLLANLYVAERLIAATEYNSKGTQEHLVVAFDFDGYESKYKPPTSTMRIFTTMLQRLYPERLETLVVLDAPFWMRAIYNILYVFISHDTRQRLQMATGSYAIETAFAPLVDDDQAMPRIRTNGKLSSPVDLNRYLYEIPFYMAYYD